MSFILLGILNSAAGAAGSKYFLSTYASVSHRAIKYKDATSLYVAGQHGGGFFFARTDELGANTSQTGLSGAYATRGGYAGLDSNNNLYFGGQGPDSSGDSKPAIYKYNSSNVLQFQRYYLGSAGGSINLNGFHVDPYGSCFMVGGRSAGSFGYAAWFQKVTADGLTLIASGEFRKAGGSAEFTDIGHDSSNNVYAFGVITEAAAYGFLVKTNYSGTVSFRKTYIPTSGASNSAKHLLVDSSGNCYLTLLGDGYATIIKTNSTGNIQWQKRLEVYKDSNCIEFDNAGNIVITYSGLIVKIDTSGNLIWQRSLTRAGSNASFDEISFDSNSDIYFTAGTFFGYLPTDGSLTGTYDMDGVSFVYSEATYTYSTAGFSEGSVTYNSETSSYASDATGLSVITPSVSQTIKNL
jgi:hypothetical protein